MNGTLKAAITEISEKTGVTEAQAAAIVSGTAEAIHDGFFEPGVLILGMVGFPQDVTVEFMNALDGLLHDLMEAK